VREWPLPEKASSAMGEVYALGRRRCLSCHAVDHHGHVGE
jgi:hypothetical protein